MILKWKPYLQPPISQPNLYQIQQPRAVSESSGRAENCPCLLDLIKIWKRYWRLKRRLPFRNHIVFFVVGCSQIWLDYFLIAGQVKSIHNVDHIIALKCHTAFKCFGRGCYGKVVNASIGTWHHYRSTCGRKLRNRCKVTLKFSKPP